MNRGEHTAGNAGRSGCRARKPHGLAVAVPGCTGSSQMAAAVMLVRVATATTAWATETRMRAGCTRAPLAAAARLISHSAAQRAKRGQALWGDQSRLERMCRAAALPPQRRQQRFLSSTPAGPAPVAAPAAGWHRPHSHPPARSPAASSCFPRCWSRLPGSWAGWCAAGGPRQSRSPPPAGRAAGGARVVTGPRGQAASLLAAAPGSQLSTTHPKTLASHPSPPAPAPACAMTGRK